MTGWNGEDPPDPDPFGMDRGPPENDGCVSCGSPEIAGNGLCSACSEADSLRGGTARTCRLCLQVVPPGSAHACPVNASEPKEAAR